MRGWQGGGEASADAWLVLRTGGVSLICILGDNPSLRAAVRFIALAGAADTIVSMPAFFAFCLFSRVDRNNQPFL